jgi:cation-transporting ATPase 13A2
MTIQMLSVTNLKQNQWGEMVVQDIDSKEYGRSLSTVFGAPEKRYAV